MSRDKLIIIGVVLFAILGFAAYKLNQKDAALGKPVAMTADLPTASAPDDIDKLSITNGEKGEVVLEKVADTKAGASEADGGGPATKWVLTKPVKAEANQQTVKDLVANLKDLKVESQVNLKLDDEVRKDKQLDKDHAVHVVAWKGSDKKVDESFGKSSTAGQLMVTSDKPDIVWAVKGYSSWLYSKEAKDFRDKEVLKFDDANVTHVTIANSHGNFLFTKGDKWTGTFDNKPIARFDEEKVKDMLRAYKSLNADDFGDGKSLSDTGLEKPEGTVTIQFKDDAKPAILLVGGTASGTDHWAKRADGDLIYQISNFASEWALSDSAKYQASLDGGAGDAGSKTTASGSKPPHPGMPPGMAMPPSPHGAPAGGW